MPMTCGAGGAARLHAGRRVFDDDAPRGIESERVCSAEVPFGIRLAGLNIGGSHEQPRHRKPDTGDAPARNVGDRGGDDGPAVRRERVREARPRPARPFRRRACALPLLLRRRAARLPPAWRTAARRSASSRACGVRARPPESPPRDTPRRSAQRSHMRSTSARESTSVPSMSNRTASQSRTIGGISGERQLRP